jgi:hypothetical protein
MRKLSLSEIIDEESEFSQERNFTVDLNNLYVGENFKKKFLMLKKKTIIYEGQECTMILIQDVTVIHVIDKEIKKTEDLI